ncbi:hypothetical protein HOI18_01050 [Candidatus Uhrbacteria bacterium]|nr:hypothetical protein [Candidatus Uhrbacteria bacterium]
MPYQLNLRLLWMTLIALFTVANSGCHFDRLDIKDGDTGIEVEVDMDGDGWSDADDCNDRDASINPAATEMCDGYDNNCDGVIDEGLLETYYEDMDGDGWGNPDAAVAMCDGDVLEGLVSSPGDCDDLDATINPLGTEVCDDVDNDCDGVIDNGLTQPWYRDADEDGYGDAAEEVETCFEPDGYVSVPTDCDDSDAEINPNADEVCDGIDNDCDLLIDDDDGDVDPGTQSTWYRDGDGDGYGDFDDSELSCVASSNYVEAGGDCDDFDAGVNPGEIEDCDGVDSDCDLTNDETGSTWYLDSDGDGYGDAALFQDACAQPSGYVLDSSDCDDTDSLVFPGGDQYCNGEDGDCDGNIDESDSLDALTWYIDGDSDNFGDSSTSLSACTEPSGYVSDATDCDDTDGDTYPGADEYCDGHDDDCDGSTDESDAVDAGTWYEDSDGDSYGNLSVSVVGCTAPTGYVADNTDCDDSDSTAGPGVAEVCDGVDNDCDGMVDEGVEITYYLDSDSDGYGDASFTDEDCSAPSGYVTNSIDCDDSNSAINPAATEVCDSIDNDCDSAVDEGLSFTYYLDSDTDGYGDASYPDTTCSPLSGYVLDSTDCDDTDPAINPGATEVCDYVDNDCDSAIDEGLLTTYYWDDDLDGYGDASTSTEDCTAPSGYVDNGDDCDDLDITVNPDGVEAAFDPLDTSIYSVDNCGDSKDNDCNGDTDALDWSCMDADGDTVINAMDMIYVCDTTADLLNDALCIRDSTVGAAWQTADCIQQTDVFTSLTLSAKVPLVDVDVDGETIKMCPLYGSIVGQTYERGISSIGLDGTSAVDTTDDSDWVSFDLDIYCMLFKASGGIGEQYCHNSAATGSYIATMYFDGAEVSP